VSDFKSKYSIRLYELLIKWLNVAKTEKYSINDLRSKLGLDATEYSTMSNFKSNVLDRAVSEINKHTNITVDYDQFRKVELSQIFNSELNQKQYQLNMN
jgi:plasmid replication initiation protein